MVHAFTLVLLSHHPYRAVFAGKLGPYHGCWCPEFLRLQAICSDFIYSKTEVRLMKEVGFQL